ncbi:MAG TPA: hypothetical protein VFL80_13315 [Thermoanaerobaculia bacterium]|nr:hypothetical protein [Thermoanaerobaculia bacterium]
MSCSDPLLLQRLIDGDLDEVQAELVSHHAEFCSDCSAAIRDLAALRTFAQERLGAEDESDGRDTEIRIARIAGALPHSTPGRPPRMWRRRPVLTTAAVAAFAAFLPLAFVTSVNAWTERILEKASARERLSKYQPNKSLYWEVHAYSRGVKRMADGRWRTRFWQRNGATAFSQISQQFDPHGNIAHAYWQRADGGALRYRPQRNVLEVTPPTDETRQGMRTLPPALQGVLMDYLAQVEKRRSLETNRQIDADWLHRPSLRHGGTATVRRRVVPGESDVYHITFVTSGRKKGGEILEATHDYDIEIPTLRLLRLKSTIHYADGTTGVHDARWSELREIPTADFDAQTPERLLGRPVTLVRLTPEEMAMRRLRERKQN